MSALPVGSFVGNDYVGGAGGPWDDIQGRITLGDAVANPTYEAYRDTPWKTYFLRHDQADELHFALQMSHAWDPTTEVRFHVHLIPMVNPAVAQKIVLTGQYAWASFGYATPADVDWTDFTGELTVGTSDAFKEAFVQCFSTTAPAAAQHESAILLIYLKRDSGGADTYTTGKSGGTAAANVAILSADCHYQKNKDGTSTEIPV
jgi:hypothetical protein